MQGYTYPFCAMAEITQSNQKSSTKVDMTPMVDLGFLLITFFMLTTTLSKPHAMELNMPHKNGNTMPIADKNSVTLVLGKDNRIHLYKGMLTPETKKEDLTYSDESFRKRLLELKNELGKEKNRNTQKLEHNIIVIIKPDDQSSYKNMIDILDEMTICGIEKYAIVDINEKDKALIKDM